MSHWTTSGRSRLRSKQDNSFAKRARMRAEVLAPEATVLIPTYAQMSTAAVAPPAQSMMVQNYSTVQQASRKKRRRSYGNPIERRGLVVPIGHHNYTEVLPEYQRGPHEHPLCQPQHRRIRDPSTCRYQPIVRQAPIVQQRNKYSMNMFPEGSEALQSDENIESCQGRSLHHVSYRKAEWGQSSVPIHVYKSTAEDFAPEPRGPPPQMYIQQPGIARFQKQNNLEIDALAQAEREWDAKSSTPIIDTESFDPKGIDEATAVAIGGHPPIWHRAAQYRQRKIFGNGSARSQWPHSQYELEIDPSHNQSVEYDQQLENALTPRNQFLPAFGSEGAFPFDRESAEPSIRQTSCENFPDTTRGFSRFQSQPKSFSRSYEFQESGMRLNQLNQLDCNDNGTRHDEAFEDNLTDNHSQKPLEIIEIPLRPLRYFNDGVEVDYNGRTISKREATPLQKSKKNAGSELPENPVQESENSWNVFFDNE